MLRSPLPDPPRPASGGGSGDHRQADGDGEANGDRGERALAARPDRPPPGGHDQQPGGEADTQRLTGRSIGIEQADQPGDPGAERQHTRAAHQPQPDRQPDLTIGDRDGELPGEREQRHEALTGGPPRRG